MPNVPSKPSELMLYLKVLIFSALLYGGAYAYTSWLKVPNIINKTTADVSIILIGLSMWLTSLGYYFNVFDTFIRYRKHLGLVGFAYGVAHILLSFSALQNLFRAETWENGLMWPALNGLLATVIFTIMTLISNTFMAKTLGGKLWRQILRTGYIAVIFVWFHVVLLKSARWITWYEAGMQTPPAMSLIVTIFMTIVVLMRIALWWSLRRQRAMTSQMLNRR